MDCDFCKEHILATTHISWNRGQYHEWCIGEAVKQFRAEQEIPLTRSIIPDDYYEALEESMDDDDEFYPDELDIDDDIIERLENIPEVADEVLNQIPVASSNGHERNVIVPEVVNEVHINDIVATVSRDFAQKKHSTLMVGKDAQYIDRNGLAGLPMPQATSTHQPIAHLEVVERLIETLSFRHIQVVNEQYAISKDGMRCCGTLELSNEWNGMRYAIGLKNANDKSSRLGLTVGMKVTVCSNLMLQGDFTPVFKKHSKSLDLTEVLSIGVDRMQRSFEPMKAQIQRWKDTQITNRDAQLIIYRAYLENKFPMQAMKVTHKEFFEPSYSEFEGRNMFSLHNAFTSSFKQLNAMRMYQETARLGKYFQSL